MWKEKVKEFFVKLSMYIAAGALAVGLVLFVAKALYQKGDVKTAEEEKTSMVNVIEGKEAAPVEIKGSISDDSLKKDDTGKAKQKNASKEEAPITLVPEVSQETAKSEELQETAEPEASQETAGLEEPQEVLAQEATLGPPEPDANGGGSDMTESLEAQIQDMISSQYAAGGSVAVSAGRISDGALSFVNSHSMQAASLIKLFVAGCMYETMGDVSQYESLISAMISVSDNTACNSLVTILGGGDAQAGMAAVNEYCMNHGFAETHMGRLMLQPNDQDDNYTSVRDCGNFLLSIYNGGLAGSDQILQYMKQQERRGKIPAGVPSGVETANKTGELDFVENDAAIVFHPSGAYVLCVMSENLSDAYTSRLFINSLSEMVYGLMG